MRKVLPGVITLLVVLALTGCGARKIPVSKSAEDYIGKNYDTIAEELKKDGFEVFREVSIEDLTSDSDMKDGTVEMIAIDGNASFKAEDKFDPESIVEIVYHMIPRAAVPIDSDDIQSMSCTELEQLFIDAGFTNTSTEKKIDLDPDKLEGEYINDVLVAGKERFLKGKEVPFDSKVVIVGHYPYEKSLVQINIHFDGNLLFSKYDVNFYIDDELVGKLEHGKSASYDKRLSPGTHRLVFANEADPSVIGEVELTVSSKEEVSYTISCSKEAVVVQEIGVIDKRELDENEARIPCKEAGFVGRNYRTVETELRQAGFTEIKTEEVENTGFFSKKTAGSVSGVTIGGTAEYQAQEIAAKETEVIIKYYKETE